MGDPKFDSATFPKSDYKVVAVVSDEYHKGKTSSLCEPKVGNYTDEA